VSDEPREDTLMQRAQHAVTQASQPAPSHIGKGGQIGGIILIGLVGWHGVAPSLHQWLHPHDDPLQVWPLWLVMVLLAAGIVLLAGAEALAQAVRAVLPILDRGK